jgi:hypothetical protein
MEALFAEMGIAAGGTEGGEGGEAGEKRRKKKDKNKENKAPEEGGAAAGAGAEQQANGKQHQEQQ